MPDILYTPCHYAADPLADNAFLVASNKCAHACRKARSCSARDRRVPARTEPPRRRPTPASQSSLEKMQRNANRPNNAQQVTLPEKRQILAEWSSVYSNNYTGKSCERYEQDVAVSKFCKCSRLSLLCW
jgi:hypothetical protein